jgi:hypothetical protein
MNLKLRLERLCDSKSWARLVFADGTALTGRVLRVGHDYLEMECYGDSDRPGMRNYAKHLVPLNLVKYITVDSTSFADAERNRLNYISEVDISQHDSVPEIEK